MTRKQALNDFIELYGGKEKFRASKKKDYYAVQLDWECYKDSLCRDGTITMHQYETWDNP